MDYENTKDPQDRQGGPRKLLSLLPLRDIVVFPYMVVPLFVGREKSIAALEEAMNKDKDILLCAQQDAKVDDPAEGDIYRIGTIGNIIQMLRLPDGTVKVLIEGRSRATIREYIPNEEFFLVYCEQLEEPFNESVETAALIRSIHAAFETYAKLNKRIPADMVTNIRSIDDPNRLADTLVVHLSNLKLEDKQGVLETVDPTERLERIFGHMRSEIEILQVERKIKNRVRKQMERTQKEYYLNEQMRAIQKELGERDEFKGELKELEERIAKKGLSKEAAQKVKAELKKLKLMSPMSAEATVVRNYIDTILNLPWDEKTEDKIDIKDAQRILDEDHYGLKKVKERILEYLAVHKLVGKIKGPILCLVGPPGVGKTSLGKSVARATGRNFVRLSLGGVRDEAEIRGHRRTYIGALPGKIIQSLRKAGTNNPVFLLDEVDKMSSDFRGDPASALLEVLDPEQNHTFNDHYLDLDYDLSEVMFITTANVLHQIPAPLQDRMEIIRLPGYTEDEQFQIAKRHLIGKQLAANGLTPEMLHLSDEGLLKIIRYYTREAGVRNLEREIANICRKVAKEIVRDELEGKQIRITARNVHKYLGVPRFRHGMIEEQDLVGLTNGLAWTEAGGELLATEVAVMRGKGRMTITGSLGDVMQESAQAAMSYVRSRAEALKLERDFYQKIDIHVHIAEGAIPKDGPSAGITMATSIVSALTRIPVKRDVAMTGEITLRGRVLPIGGLKEKVLAAHRGQIRTVILPKENEKDLKEVPSNVLRELRIVLAEGMDEVLKEALVLDDPDSLFEDVIPEQNTDLEKQNFPEVRGPLV